MNMIKNILKLSSLLVLVAGIFLIASLYLHLVVIDLCHPFAVAFDQLPFDASHLLGRGRPCLFFCYAGFFVASRLVIAFENENVGVSSNTTGRSRNTWLTSRLKRFVDDYTKG